MIARQTNKQTKDYLTPSSPSIQSHSKSQPIADIRGIVSSDPWRRLAPSATTRLTSLDSPNTCASRSHRSRCSSPARKAACTRNTENEWAKTKWRKSHTTQKHVEEKEQVESKRIARMNWKFYAPSARFHLAQKAGISSSSSREESVSAGRGSPQCIAATQCGGGRRADRRPEGRSTCTRWVRGDRRLDNASKRRTRKKLTENENN
jgi:hypothetical protein